MGHCLWTGKQSGYRAGQLSLSSLLVCKLSTVCLAEVKAGHVHLCRVGGNAVWSRMAGDAP